MIDIGVYAYLRALFFEHDAEIGQKDHFGTGTNEQPVLIKRFQVIA